MPTKSITCQHKVTHIQIQLSWKVAATSERDLAGNIIHIVQSHDMTTSATVLLDPTKIQCPLYVSW